ncbi:MAG TPA: diguanylate cyclase [Steroidobacteraceae bacterium]
MSAPIPSPTELPMAAHPWRARRKIGPLYWIRTLSVLVLLIAMVPQAAAQQLSFRQYTQSDGLTNLAAEFLEKDTDGSLWVGTDGALFRFDGSTFKAYDKRNGLPTEDVRGMAEDRRGRLWVVLDRGLYVGDAAGFHQVRTSSGPVLVDHATAITLTRDQRLLAITDKRVIEITHDAAAADGQWSAKPFFSDMQVRLHPQIGSVSRVFAAPDGSLWLGCAQTLCRFANGTLTVLTEANGVPPSTYTNFLIDRNRQLWARSAEHLLMRQGGDLAFIRNEPPDAVLSSRAAHPLLALDPQGRVLVRTAGGLARWNGTTWRQFTAANGLPDTMIAAALVDGEGSLWLAPTGFGLWRWQGYDNVESWTRRQGLASDKIWNIVRDHSGHLLIGTERRCQMLDEQQARFVECPYSDLPRQEVAALAIDRTGGTWWGLDNGELWHIPLGQSRAVRVPLGAGRLSFSSISFDRDGTGWLACFDDGLFRLDVARGIPVKVDLPASKATVYDTAEDAAGGIWAAAAGGLFHLWQGRWTFVPVRDEEGLSAVIGSVAARPDGSLWASSFGKGLVWLDSHDPARQKWVLPAELATASVYSIQADQRAWLWANTDQGIAVFDGKDWRRFDVNDGLIWNDTQQDAFLADRDGSVWIGTSNGLTHIKDPERLLQAGSRLELHISSARLGANDLLGERNPALQWQSNEAFDLQLSSNSFTRSPNTEFRYRLLGLSSEWFGSNIPRIHLPALAPGRYTLEAVAVDTAHDRRSSLVSLAFRVLPPWWDTVWFRLLVVLAVGALLTWLWRWQMERQHARRAALEREHREREILLERATRDALTGLWNRATIFEALKREIEHSHRSQESLAVAFIDVDHFKRINDTFGHPGGDEVLQQLAHRLSSCIRQSDRLGRYGGEEFLIVLPGLSRPEAGVLLERLRESVSNQPFGVQNATTSITVSAGVAWCESITDTADTLIACADAALYEAKEAGRNCIVYSVRTKTRDADTSSARRYLPDLIERLTRAQRRAGGKSE